MAEDITAGTSGDNGQSATGPQIETTVTEPVSTSGQSATAETTGSQSTGTQDDVIFDPGEFDRLTKSLPPELQAQATALRKSLQSNYSKKTQAIAENRKKIEEYDNFQRDPVGQIQQMAARMGYRLTRAEAQAVQNTQNQQNDWEPQSWDEVLTKAEERAMQKIMGQLQPLLGEVQTMKKSAIESQLNEIDPMWHEYEQDMIQNLQDHPTLAKDPAKLYRMSVPPEVFESRATQRALRKLEQKAQSGKMQGSSTTSKQPQTGLPDGPVSFSKAVEIAKAKLEERGIRPPH